jgi:hypothetical protein
MQYIPYNHKITVTLAANGVPDGTIKVKECITPLITNNYTIDMSERDSKFRGKSYQL